MVKPKENKRTKKNNRKPEMIAPPFHLTPLHYYMALVTAGFGFILYINTINHGYVLDDYSAITINRFVHEGFSGIPKLMTVDFWYFSNMQLGYYRPLSLITFAVEYQFAGVSPQVSHTVNIFLFALSVFLVSLLVSRLFSGANPVFPFLITVLFAAHPIHTEVIDNLKGRDELLSFLNSTAMLYFAIRYLDTRKKWRLVLGLLFFYLALLSKESAMIGVALLPLVFRYTQSRSLGNITLQVLPYVGILILVLVQKRLALGPDSTVIPNDIVNYPYRGAAVKLPTTFLLFLFGMRMLVFPYPLRYDYSFNLIPATEWNSVWAILGLILFAGFVVAGVNLLRKKHPLGLILGYFLIAMIPMMAFTLMRGGIFAERNLYAASLPFCMAVVYLLHKVTKIPLSAPPQATLWKLVKPVSPILIPVVLISAVYGYLTVKRNPAWKDPLTLFATDISTGERSAQNQLHYGYEMVRTAESETDPKVKDSLIDIGKTAIRRALYIHPRFADAMYRYGYAHEITLTYRVDLTTVDSTIYYFNKAIEIAPAYAEAHYHLGIIYEWLQRFDVASYYFNRAYELDPVTLEAKQKADHLRETKGLDVRVNPLTKP